MQQQLEKRGAAAAKRDANSRRHLQRLAEAAARRERDNALLRVQDDGIRLGSLSVIRAGPIGEPVSQYTDQMSHSDRHLASPTDNHKEVWRHPHDHSVRRNCTMNITLMYAA